MVLWGGGYFVICHKNWGVISINVVVNGPGGGGLVNVVEQNYYKIEGQTLCYFIRLMRCFY